jgi:hypothetical protein
MDLEAVAPVTRSPGPAPLVRYAVTWVYVLGFIVAEAVFAALPVRDQAAVLGWASTNVANLRQPPLRAGRLRAGRPRACPARRLT